MKPTLQFIEQLEPRVAPAILVNGGNLLGGNGNPSTGETSTGGNTVTLIKVIKGEALVFFDASGAGQITSISVGKHTKLDVTGNIGDIVTNLGPDGRLTDSDNNPGNGEDGGILLPINFAGLTTHPLGSQLGSVGRIIAGGSVKNINVAGDLSGIYAGDGVFKSSANGEIDVSTGNVDYNTITPGLDNTFRLHAGTAQSSAIPAISNVTVGIADHLQVFAGDGTVTNGIANPGGSITNITVTKTQASDLTTPAIYLHAGDGAAGSAGGAGGTVTMFTDVASTSYIKLQTGNGGAASAGLGGAGGSFTNSTITSNATRYEILLGSGGAGDIGGAGGSVKTVTFSDAVSGGTSLIATGYFLGADNPLDVLFINTVTGNATLSEGTTTSTSSTEAPFQVVLHPAVAADGSATTTPFIAPVGSVPTGVVATDVNGDGKLDFIVSYGSSDNLGIFINDGTGNFTASSVALPVSPTHIAVGNFTSTTHQDVAILSAGDLPGGGGTLFSQIYLAEGDGLGHFNTISAPVTFAGVATAIVSGQLNGAGGSDLVVGLMTGSVDTFLENGSTTAAPFTLGSTMSVFGNGPISNLDIAPGTSGNTLLAFTTNMNATAPATVGTGTTLVVPFVQLLNINNAGKISTGIGFAPTDDTAVAAHFIGGTDIGVASATGIAIYTPDPSLGTYTSSASISTDGALTDFIANTNGNFFQITAVGASTSRFFSTTGSLDNTSGIGTLEPFDIPGEPFVTTIHAGAGGAGDTHNGGKGGSFNNLSYTQTLGAGIGSAGARFDITLDTGDGGSSNTATGGKGGTMQKVTLSLDPADYTGFQDSTTLAVLGTGVGGDGFIGGHGGSMLNVSSNSVLNQLDSQGRVVPNSVAVQLLAGAGGNGSGGAGGDGGSITLAAKPALSGVSCFDPTSATPFAVGLLVQSGNGGNGATTGGNGGALVNIQTQNATVGTGGTSNVENNELASASINSGAGGTGANGAGGSGGAITGLNVTVESQKFGTPAGTIVTNGGALVVKSGAGGASGNGAGGAGGAITKSTAASVDGDGYRGADLATYGNPPADPYYGVGVLMTGGAGGSGTTGGGAGGGIKQLNINSPSATDVYGAVLMGGEGGAATVSGTGGSGGGVHGVTQREDVNSSLSVLQGGDGGTSAGGTGGKGGSIKNVDTVGFIGLPATDTTNLAVFNDTTASPLIASLFGTNIPQGIFAGRGADGGISGSVINVVARQIAAIGASENASGLFGVASAVDNIQADLIGYEVVRDNIFTSTVPGASPAVALPIDGFILAASVAEITTADNARTASFTFNG